MTDDNDYTTATIWQATRGKIGLVRALETGEASVTSIIDDWADSELRHLLAHKLGTDYRDIDEQALNNIVEQGCSVDYLSPAELQERLVKTE
jgi:hypothetical protein